MDHDPDNKKPASVGFFILLSIVSIIVYIFNMELVSTNKMIRFKISRQIYDICYPHNYASSEISVCTFFNIKRIVNSHALSNIENQLRK